MATEASAKVPSHFGLPPPGQHVRPPSCKHTFWLGGLEEDADEFGDVKVGSVMERVHVGPAAAQRHICVQGQQLVREAHGGSRITWDERKHR